MRYIGTSDISIEDGDVTNPITIDGETVTVKNGDVVGYGANGDIKKEFIWTGSKWEEFGNEGNYKVKQQAKGETATATQTIQSISQNENGDIDVKMQDIAFPVTSVNGQKGAVTIDVPKALADLTADSTHRTVTDDEKVAWNAKSNFSGNYNDLTNKPTAEQIGAVPIDSYDQSKTQLPLTVLSNGTVAPAKLTAQGIYGAEKISNGEMIDQTIERLEDYYLLQSNGGATYNASIGINLGTAPIVPGKEYHVTLYASPDEFENTHGFYNGDPTADRYGYYMGAAFIKTVALTVVQIDNTDIGTGVYSFIAPEGASHICYSYYDAQGGFCKTENSSAEDSAYNLSWLKVAAENIEGAEGVSDAIIEDQTSTRWEDHYVNQDNGGLVPNTSLGISVGGAPIVPGNEYQVTIYANPNEFDGTHTLYNADPSGNFYNTYLGKEFTKSVVFTAVNTDSGDIGTGVYSFIAPEGASFICYSYYKTQDGYCLGESTVAAEGVYKLPWLRITEENLSDELKTDREEKTYGHSLNKPFNFNGKKMFAFGDSITFGISSPNLVYTYQPYIKTFAEKCGMSLTNRAESGTCITDWDDELGQGSMYKKLTTFTETADVILIAGGTNDYGTGKPIGDYSSTNPKTLYGAMRGICQALQNNQPNATVIFVTPIARTDTVENVEPLNVYRNAIFEIASEYGFNVVDGSKLGFPDEADGFGNFMIADGVHPTQAGHDFYAKNLYNAFGFTDTYTKTEVDDAIASAITTVLNTAV